MLVISMKKTIPKARLIPMASRKPAVISFGGEPSAAPSGSSGGGGGLWRLTRRFCHGSQNQQLRPALLRRLSRRPRRGDTERPRRNRHPLFQQRGSGAFRRGPLRGGISGSFQVAAHEPLEELQLLGLTDEQVLGDRIGAADLAHHLTVVFDDSGVDLVQLSQVSLDAGLVQRVVLPAALRDQLAGE